MNCIRQHYEILKYDNQRIGIFSLTETLYDNIDIIYWVNDLIQELTWNVQCVTLYVNVELHFTIKNMHSIINIVNMEL